MSAKPNPELEQVEEATSAAPAFTFGDIIHTWVLLSERYAGKHCVVTRLYNLTDYIIGK